MRGPRKRTVLAAGGAPPPLPPNEGKPGLPAPVVALPVRANDDDDEALLPPPLLLLLMLVLLPLVFPLLRLLFQRTYSGESFQIA
jgi:hypothetical protein